MKTIILYEDKDVIVAHKSASLATQTARAGQVDVVSELKNYLATGQSAPYLGVVHRLDQPVEGLLVFAKNKGAAANLTGQLGTGILNKHYYAVAYCAAKCEQSGEKDASGKSAYLESTCGKLAPEENELVDYMYKDKDNRAVIVTGRQQQCPEAKKAVLRYVVKKSEMSGSGQEAGASVDKGRCHNNVMEGHLAEGLALLDVCIETGRFHQIRAQLAHAGLPLLGDSKYGTDQSMEYSKARGVRNVALCAYRIIFRHPTTGKEMDFSIEPENPAFRLV